MMRRVIAGIALAVAVSTGCSKASQTGTAEGARGTANLVTRQEIASVPEGNLYDALQRLRPAFLRPRSTATAGSELPVVFVDGLRRGSLDYLRAINNREVAEVRYVGAIDATTRYGLNVPAGVLDVKLVTR